VTPDGGGDGGPGGAGGSGDSGGSGGSGYSGGSGADARVDRTDTRPRWSVNPAVGFGAGAAGVLGVLALIAGRPEFALLAVPLLIVVAVGLDRRPRHDDTVTVTNRLSPDTDSSGVGYDLGFTLPDGAEAVAVALTTADGGSPRFAVTREAAARILGRVPVTHSGPQDITAVDYSLLGAAGAAMTSPDPGPTSSRLIPPPRLRIDSLPLPHRVVGITGAHESRTPGDGGEFRDVALFSPGDRLRRIDWKVTARRAQLPGDLYVRRTFSTADAIVMLIVDDRDEVAADVTTWAGIRGSATTATSLDLAREAASSLAAAYLAAGDRVGLRDLAGTARSVDPGSGTRQLQRLQTTIAQASPTGQPVKSVRTPVLPASSLVVVLSSFLDEQAATMAITWASTGHRVLAVDTLPQPLLGAASREQRTAFQLVMMERTNRLDAMTASGVEPLRWDSAAGAPVPSVQLRTLTRPRRRR
jgi:uncharacterized protein (DUF58 family)